MPVAVSRRRFVGLAAGAIGAAMLPKPLLRADEKEFPGFVLGIQSYSLRGLSTEDCIKHSAEIGFKNIEFYSGHFPLESSEEQISAMRQSLEAAGLTALGHGVNGFSADHEANRRTFEFARRAGVKNLSADPSPDSFDNLDKLVAEYDIRIAIHNHGPNARYDKIVDVLRAVESHDPRIGACADLGHFIRSGEDPIEAIRLFGDRLFGIHLKDFAEQQEVTRGVILGQGHLDVEGVFLALKQVNFPIDGCLSLEYEENPDNPLDDVRQCYEIAREAAEKAA